MQIAVFGGAFDPPHLGHQAIAQYLIDSKKADQVWFLPVKIHHFVKDVAPAEHRLAMLELIVAKNEEVWRINPYELETSDQTYNKTYLTLQYFKKLYQDDTFSFVIGADNLARFKEWDFYQELLREFPVWVYPRSGLAFEPLLPGMVPMREAPEVTFSSTDIRDKIARGESIAGLVEPEVEQYINSHHLYVKN